MNIDRDFARRIAALESPGLIVEPDAVRLHELAALFDTFLPDATTAERGSIETIQRDLQAQQWRLQSMLTEGVLSPGEYAATLNRELELTVRRCARTLGPERSTQFLGVREDSAALIIAENIVRHSEDELLSSAVAKLTAPTLGRYEPKLEEQLHVVQAVRAWEVNASHRSRDFPGLRRFNAMWQRVDAAEKALSVGNIAASLLGAKGVVTDVDALHHITDAPLYLAAWAHHVQGRVFEFQNEHALAYLHYEASLALKLGMMTWLPETSLIVTEIKLGAVEASSAPVEGVTRLRRLVDVLTLSRASFNPGSRIYANLLQDSHISLADAYLATGDRGNATRTAQMAWNLALGQDSIGEIRSIFVLYQSRAMSHWDAHAHIAKILRREVGLDTHPRVAAILVRMGPNSPETEDAP